MALGERRDIMLTRRDTARPIPMSSRAAPMSSRREFRKAPHAEKLRALPREYLRLAQLGRGGFARVYEMLDETGEKVAVKVVHKGPVKKANAEAKLRSEIQIHSTLEHYTVVRFLKCFEDIENAYLVLELCPNGALSDYVRAKPGRVISSPEAVYFASDLLAGLFYLRENMVIHRDLKLSNLFLDTHMHLKIGDFGLAAQLEDSQDVRHTVCGTPNYIAPEILDVKSGHSFEADLWSFGVIAYTLIIGRPPFETENLRMTYRKIRKMEYTFPNTVPPEAKEMIAGVLQTNVNVRWTLDDILHCAWMNQPSVAPTVTPATLSQRKEDQAARPPRPVSMEPRPSRAHQPAQARTATVDARRPHAVANVASAARARCNPSPRAPCLTHRPAPFRPSTCASARSVSTNVRSRTPPTHRRKSHDASPRTVACRQIDARKAESTTSRAPTSATKRAWGYGGGRPTTPQAETPLTSRGGYSRNGTPREECAAPNSGGSRNIRNFFKRATSATCEVRTGHREGKSSTATQVPHTRPPNQQIPPARQVRPTAKGAQYMSARVSYSSSTREASSHASQNRPSGSGLHRRDFSGSRTTTLRTDRTPSPSSPQLATCAPPDESPMALIVNTDTSPTCGSWRRPLANSAVRPLRLDQITGDLRTMGPDTRTSEMVRGMETVRVRHVGQEQQQSPSSRTIAHPARSGPVSPLAATVPGTSTITPTRVPTLTGMAPCFTPLSRSTLTGAALRAGGSTPSRVPPLAESGIRPATPTFLGIPSSPSVRAVSGTPACTTPQASSTQISGMRSAMLASCLTPPASKFTLNSHLQSASLQSAPPEKSHRDILLTECQASRHTRARARPQVLRWVDYSKKYGIGALMSDNTINVRFNDLTYILASSSDSATEFYYVRQAKRYLEAVSTYSFSSYPVELRKKVTLFVYFRSTLLSSPSDGVGTIMKSRLPVSYSSPKFTRESIASPQNSRGIQARQPKPDSDMTPSYPIEQEPRKGILADTVGPPSDLTFVDKWCRGAQSVFFRLSNKSVQVIFFDNTELFLDEEQKVVRYVNARGKYFTCFYDDYTNNPEMEKRVMLAKNVIAAYTE